MQTTLFMYLASRSSNTFVRLTFPHHALLCHRINLASQSRYTLPFEMYMIDSHTAVGRTQSTQWDRLSAQRQCVLQDENKTSQALADVAHSRQKRWFTTSCEVSARLRTEQNRRKGCRVHGPSKRLNHHPDHCVGSARTLLSSPRVLRVIPTMS